MKKFIALLLLIFLRPFLNSLSFYVNLANYISMIISISGVFLTTIKKSIHNRNRNICKSIFLIIIIVLIIPAFIVLYFNLNIHQCLNDIFTLIALLFCISNKVIEEIIIGIFSLNLKDT